MATSAPHTSHFDAFLSHYDPSTGTFTATGSMTTARALHAAVLLPDGTVLIVGGINNPNAATSAELYDPFTGTFTATGAMAGAHSLAILLNNGKIFVTGGFGQTPVSPAPNAELYDPATGQFTAAGAYADASAAGLLTANLLADGRVLITGTTFVGSDFDGDVAEVYDPAADSFTLTAGGYNNAFAKGLTATSLMSGKVLFAGGVSEAGLVPYTYLFDPSTATFARTGNMTMARYNHAATLLADGTALITGGGLGSVSAVATSSAELYDLSTGAFSLVGHMTIGRTYHAATLLGDGRVLISGRAFSFPTTWQVLSTAELYTRPSLVPAECH